MLVRAVVPRDDDVAAVRRDRKPVAVYERDQGEVESVPVSLYGTMASIDAGHGR